MRPRAGRTRWPGGSRGNSRWMTAARRRLSRRPYLSIRWPGNTSPTPFTPSPESRSTLPYLRRLIGLALLLPVAAPLRAQQEVRYVLVITGGIPPYLRGELRLSRSGRAWRGTLAMEDRDSLVPVTAIAHPGDSLLFEAPLLGGMSFRGRQVRDNVAG